MNTFQVLSQVGTVIFTGSREACVAYIDNCQAKGIWEIVGAPERFPANDHSPA